MDATHRYMFPMELEWWTKWNDTQNWVESWLKNHPILPGSIHVVMNTSQQQRGKATMVIIEMWRAVVLPQVIVAWSREEGHHLHQKAPLRTFIVTRLSLVKKLCKLWWDRQQRAETAHDVNKWLPNMPTNTWQSSKPVHGAATEH